MNIAANRPRGEAKCSTCAVVNRALCRAADPCALAELDRISHVRRYRRGQTVLCEEAEAPIVGHVVSGVLKMTKTLKDGRSQIVGLLFASDFFGRAYARTARFSLEAAGDSELCVMDRLAFEAVLARHHAVEHALLTEVLDELDATREWMVLLGCQNAREKVASFLLKLHGNARHRARTGARQGAETDTIEVPISRRDMAGYLGTTVETISRHTQALARLGVLRVLDSRHVQITDPAALAAAAAHPDWHDGERRAMARAGRRWC